LADAAGLDLYVPTLPYVRFFSLASPAEVTARLLADLDRLCTDPNRYARIFLVGHSIGAVIARRLFLVAAGINNVVPSEGPLQAEQARPWAVRVCRIVAFAALSRGWIRSGRLGWVESATALAVAIAGHGWPGTRAPTLFEVRRGAPFIVQTRLQWLAMQRDPTKPKPLVVHLLGTQDNLVAPDDAVDFAVDGAASGNYLYIELPQTNHVDAVAFTPNSRDLDGHNGARRKKLFIAALAEDHQTLSKRSIDRAFLSDTLPPPPDETVTQVTFVIHGIRDDGYWTRRIAQRIHEAAQRHSKPPGAYRSITSSYGYFAMLPFIWPWIRREKVEWLMDEYVGAVSRYPRAEFSYVGHSNGTYLLARALEDYPAVRFRNVFFAGSVVRQDYTWGRFIAAQRVRNVVNMVATADWVVAIFPSGLEPLRPFDLGGAGFRGFRQVHTEPNLHEVHYVVGGHSAALVETQWTRIAEFIVSDTIPSPPDPDYQRDQSCLWRVATKISSVLLLVVILLFGAAPLYALLHAVPNLTGLAAAVRVAAAFAYLLVLWLVITRI
jgi:pimeloyl-ACP methyl ester carboxylesterase